MEAATGVRPYVGRPAAATPNYVEKAAASRAADWPRTTRLLPWLLFGFLAMIWVIPFDSVILPSGLPVNLTLDRAFLIVLTIAWVLGDTEPAREHRVSRIHWAFGIFAAIAIISVLANSEALVRVGDIELAIKQMSLLCSYVIFFGLAASIVRASEVSKMITGLIVFACITAVAVIVEYRFGINVFHEYIGPLFPGYVRPPGIGEVDSIGRKQIFGPTVQPLATSVMLAMALPFALSWLLKSTERRDRILYSIAVVILIGGALATQKKTSAIGPLVVIGVFIAYKPRAMARLIPLALVMLVVTHFTAPGALGGVIDQLAPHKATQVNSTQDRVGDYEAIEPDVAARPLIGRGYGSYDQIKHRILDNQYLTLAIGVGFLGIVAYLAIFILSFFAAHPIARSGDPDRAPPAMAVVAGLAVALVGGAILDFLSFPQLSYLFCMFAAIAYIYDRERREKRAARA
jgi:polysaccharide biosynthesis protein PslJ